jgi:hypothetical protein
LLEFSNTLQQAIHDALAEAKMRRHEFVTLEHLLLSLIDEPDAGHLMRACAVDLEELRGTVKTFLDWDLFNIISYAEENEAVPTADVQRVIENAAAQVETARLKKITGANVIQAIFTERWSKAASFLGQYDMTRNDAMNFIVHGVAKDPDFNEASSAANDKPAEELLTEAEWRMRFEADLDAGEKEPVTDSHQTRSSAARFVFLSYSSQDRDFARGLTTQIKGRGLPLWWDQDIAPGDEWRAHIAEQLEQATVVLTLWTRNSTLSKAVIEEASTAQAQRKLVHVRLDSSDIPYGFSETQYVDLRDWDGSESHPDFRQLLYALQDKLAIPTTSYAETRIQESNPVEVVAHDGQLTVRDAPANAPATVINPADLEARLEGLRQTVGNMCRMCADKSAYQLPPSLHHSLEAIQTACTGTPVTWYALDDARTLLQDCMDDSYAADSWNNVVFKGLKRLMARIEEIRPLLQPVQVDPETNAPRPPVPEPVVAEDDVAEVISLAEAAHSELSSEEGRSVVDENTVRQMKNALQQLVDQKDAQGDRKLFRLRRSLKNATFIVGGLVTAIGTGVAVNLLTAPAAAQTLLLRLKPIFEAMLQFFL